MDNETIKEALSYSLGSDMHEVWRNSRKREDGTYEPRIKKSKDEEWLKRNSWVFDPNYGDPKLAVPYSELSQEEKDKDIAQLLPACNKVEAYKQGLINIDELCDKYGIQSGKTL